MTRLKVGWILLVLVLPFVSLAQAETAPPVGGDYWWNDRVFYEIFVRSFKDSNGDGVGDIRGITQQLDYLNDGDPTTTDDLGITGIWLMPIMPSPSYHGYDVTDYFGINSDYGTMEDFEELLVEAHARGIAIIIDLVMNHTSNEHPWFAASAQDPDGDYGDWYIWSEEDPNYRGPDNQQVWHLRGGRYYYGVFWSGMPDLNYTNPDVTAEMYEIARYWLEDIGVDGFRLDAIKFIIEEGRIQSDSLSTREWLADFHTHVLDVSPEALLVGEVWSSSTSSSAYVGSAVDLVFEFDLAEAMIQSASFGIRSSTRNQMQTVQGLYPQGQYATFLTNHDQNRVMNQLSGNEVAAKAAASMLLTLPGVPFIYYGEEIGMTGTKPDPDIRTPMQWGGNPPGVGFTVARPYTAVNADWENGVTVADQISDPESLLSHYRNLIQLRNATPALLHGDYVAVASETGSVDAFLRRTEDQTVLVLLNLRDRPADGVVLSVEGAGLDFSTVTPLYGVEGPIAAPELSDGGFSGWTPLAELPPLAVIVLQLD